MLFRSLALTAGPTELVTFAQHRSQAGPHTGVPALVMGAWVTPSSQEGNRPGCSSFASGGETTVRSGEGILGSERTVATAAAPILDYLRRGVLTFTLRERV